MNQLKKLSSILLLSALFAAGRLVAANNPVAGQSFSVAQQEYHVWLGQYYQVPQETIFSLLRQGIAEQELPLLLLMANLSKTQPQALATARLQGRSWLSLLAQQQLDPTLLMQTPLQAQDLLAPFDRLYRYQNLPQHGGVKIKDEDLINAANLTFIADECSLDPAEVMQAYAQGAGFFEIWAERFHQDAAPANLGPQPYKRQNLARKFNFHTGPAWCR